MPVVGSSRPHPRHSSILRFITATRARGIGSGAVGPEQLCPTAGRLHRRALWLSEAPTPTASTGVAGGCPVCDSPRGGRLLHRQTEGQQEGGTDL